MKHRWFLLVGSLWLMAPMAQAAAPILEGTYASACKYEGLSQDFGIATRSFEMFSGDQQTMRVQYYSDSKCEKEIADHQGNQTQTFHFTVGEAVKKITYPRGPAYKIILQKEGEMPVYGCFYLDPQGFEDTAALYFGEEWAYSDQLSASCSLNTHHIYAKVK